MKLLTINILFLILPSITFAVENNLFTIVDSPESLPGQLTKSTCQSNIIALALFHSGYKSELFLDKEANLASTFHREVKILEKKLRDEIEKIGGTNSNRRQWAQAIQNITQSEYTLKGSDLPIGTNFFTHIRFQNFVRNHFKFSPACENSDLVSCFTKNTISSRPALLITSLATFVNTDGIYQDHTQKGHIVAILDAKEKGAFKAPPYLDLYVLNTYQPNVGSISCNEGEAWGTEAWKGALGWLSIYFPRYLFSGKQSLALNWIERIK